MRATYSNTHLKSYCEETAVKALYKNMTRTLDKQVNLYEETGEDFPEDILIIVNGKLHAFYAGGPQAEGIFAFIRNICDENLYEKPWADATPSAGVDVTAFIPDPTEFLDELGSMDLEDQFTILMKEVK